jgi:hypothetical protein
MGLLAVLRAVILMPQLHACCSYVFDRVPLLWRGALIYIARLSSSAAEGMSQPPR